MWLQVLFSELRIYKNLSNISRCIKLGSIAEFPAQPKTILVNSWHLRPLSSSFVAVCHLCSHVCHTSCKRCGLCHYIRLRRQRDSVICISHNSTVYWFFCKHNFKHNWLLFEGYLIQFIQLHMCMDNPPWTLN